MPDLLLCCSFAFRQPENAALPKHPNKGKPSMKTRLPVRAASQPAHAPVQISMRTVRSANYGVYPKNYERQIR